MVGGVGVKKLHFDWQVKVPAFPWGDVTTQT